MNTLEILVANPEPKSSSLGNPQLPKIKAQLRNALMTKATIVITAEGKVKDNPSLNCLAAKNNIKGKVPILMA